MFKHIPMAAFALLLAAGCGSRAPVIIVPPYRPASDTAGFESTVDPEIARIYADPPIFGRVPGGLSWSPDGSRLAFTRTVTGPDGAPRVGLWTMDRGSLRESALLVDADLPVDEFAWLGSAAVVVVSGGDIHRVGIDGSRVQLTRTEADEESVAATADGARIAFVRGQDVYVIEAATGAERAITSDGTELRYYGGVTWVYGEELGTKTGLGWSADGRRLWFSAVDETEVTRRPVISDSLGTIREQAYPRAGERNPIVKVGVADLEGPAPIVSWLKTGESDDIYLPQVTWNPGGEWLAVARLDRLQTKLELLRCAAVSGACKTIIEERDPRWINLPPPPVFIDGGKQFLWLSERSGFSHIHLVGEDGLVKRQLTDGDWAVSSVDSVDEKSGWIYFTANASRPTEDGVFKVGGGGGEVMRVTPEGGVHSPVFSPDSKLFADSRSSLRQPPRVDLFTSEGELAGTLAAGDLGRYESPDTADEIFPIDTHDGHRFWAHLTRPKALEPGRRYPVLVNVYGGPGAQTVKDQFRTSFQAWRNLLASRGILVFSMDGRGSSGRGRDFETVIHRDLTAVELADQLVGVEYLKRQPFVDSSRLAVFGWSYGGTMTLKALLDAKGVFKAGVAVAPVTDWTEYDTAYTERYMQRPSDNPDGYARTSLVARAAELDTPLLLVHGMADDNVHLSNSARFVEELVKGGRIFELMLYPGRDHGIRGAKWRTHLFTRINRFIEKHL